MMVKITKIGFYGIRNLGAGLVQTVINKGLTAVIYEKDYDVYQSALNIIERNIDNEIEHWGLTLKDKKVMLSRMEHIENLSDFSKHDIDIIIESVEDRLQRKREVREKIKNDVNMNIPVIFTSQTNSLKDLLEDSDIASKCVNIHPVPSVPIYKLIELFKSENTSDTTFEIVKEFITKIDLKIVELKDGAGLIGPRVLIATILEACDVMRETGVSPEEFDYVMKKGLKMYKGPLSMADEIGLDNIKIWIEELSKIDSSVYKVPEILKNLLDKGYTGIKVKQGFLNYR
uniref:3-hydroxyacyl-CoA dehydrogenase family protein n=1 Tax=candidate division WOR-3 bacterium TaxID=2052148 RepID=A0A7C3J6I6_UNCW3